MNAFSSAADGWRRSTVALVEDDALVADELSGAVEPGR